MATDTQQRNGQPWTARAVPVALDPAALAELVDKAQSRAEGLLFTATPRDELDEIGRWQRLEDLAWAGKARAVVAAANSAGSWARPFAGDETALAIGASPTTGSMVVAEALAAGELPGLLEAVEDATFTTRHVKAVLRELAAVELTLEQRQAVVAVLLARYRGQYPGETAALVRRLILTVDRAAAEARKRVKDRLRQVRITAGVDGQASVWACGPAEQIARVQASLDAALASARAAGRAEDDDRTADAWTFDLFIDLLTGDATAGTWTASVLVPFTTAEGGELELAEIPGLGPILPSTVQDLLDGVSAVSQVAVDAETGQVLAVSDPIARRLTSERTRALPAHSRRDLGLPADLLDRLSTAPTTIRLGTSSYRIPRRLARLVQARDGTCTFPGCRRRASTTDLDHRIPWPRGATDADNLHCLCRHHHRAKQAVFTVRIEPDGSTTWTTRGGWEFTRRPWGY